MTRRGLKPTGIYLYALLFNDGVVKVGQTIQPGDRPKTHQRDARKLSYAIRDGWISKPYMLRSDERRLIEFCNERWPLVQGLEYFDGDFNAIVSYAEDLEEAALVRRLGRAWQFGLIDIEADELLSKRRP